MAEEEYWFERDSRVHLFSMGEYWPERRCSHGGGGRPVRGDPVAGGCNNNRCLITI